MNFTFALIFIVKYSYENQVTQSSSFSCHFGGATDSEVHEGKHAFLSLYLLQVLSMLFSLLLPTLLHCEVLKSKHSQGRSYNDLFQK